MSPSHSRRTAGLVGVALAALAALATFASAGGAKTNDTSTLTIAVAGDVQTLDPAYANFIQAHWALEQMYDTPVNLKTVKAPDGSLVATSAKIEPMIFKSWKRSADGLTYTVEIRKGVKFQDGTPLTAEAVKWTFDRNLSTKGGMNWLLTNIAFITKKPKLLGPYTIQLKADKPSVLAMQALYMDGGGILNPTVVKPHATASDPWATKWLSTHATDGTGPFALSQRTPDQELVFKANDAYWAGAPKLKTIVWKIVPSSAQRLSLLKAGAVDVADGLTPDQLTALEATSGVKVVRSPSDSQTMIGLNNLTGAFKSKELRQAASYGIDYNAILADVYHGHAARTYGPVATSSPYAVPKAAGYHFDLAKAKELVQSSGYGGETVTLSIDSSRQTLQDIAVRVKSQLGAAGINVQIQQLAPAVYAQRLAKKQLEMYVDTLLPWISDPNYVLSLEYQCNVFGNYVGYCDKGIDKVITAGWAETNEAKRHAMFMKAQKQIIADAPYVWLAQPTYDLAMRSNVQGFVHRQNEIPWFYTMWKTS
jgi:peptide/nickel transport system substrate-binding protein